MKGVVVILDGVADEPLSALGGMTPLGAARTPHLDSLARVSRLSSCTVIKEGIAPESSTGVLSLLGIDPHSAARGSLEAYGARIPFSRGDLVLRTNFATIDDITSLQLLDRRAGRTLSTREAQVLARAINSQVHLPYPFRFYPTVQHRGVVVFKGGFSDNFSNVDPHYGAGTVHSDNDRVCFAESHDDDAASKLGADLVNMFVRRSYEVLDVHPLNVLRAKKGLYSANFLLCRDPGVEVPRLPKLRGSWMALAYMPLEQGIARAAKMDVQSFSYPVLRGIDVYDVLYKGLGMALKQATRMLSRHAHRYDYFLIHFKETDIPGHDNKPADKVRMIELIDQRFFSFLAPFVKKHRARTVITADHTTSCRHKAHTADPVPVLFYDPLSESNAGVRFNELESRTLKSFTGKHLLERTLFS